MSPAERVDHAVPVLEEPVDDADTVGVLLERPDKVLLRYVDDIGRFEIVGRSPPFPLDEVRDTYDEYDCYNGVSEVFPRRNDGGKLFKAALDARREIQLVHAVLLRSEWFNCAAEVALLIA